MAEKQRYNYMENALQQINAQFISLPENEVKKHNQLLDLVIDTLLDQMKKEDRFFDEKFNRIFYGGSFYDGVKVGKPNEFDLNLVLRLPKYIDPIITTSDIPGFVHVNLIDLEDTEDYKHFKGLLNRSDYLDSTEVLSWMESIVQKALNDFPDHGKYRNLSLSLSKSGPALTLTIDGPEVHMDIDLVAVFEFGDEKWPAGEFRENPVQSKTDFFIVPKKPKNIEGDRELTIYWRLSFQEQERELIDDMKFLKPTFKLIKKLRDTQNHHPIASYYIKNVFLNILEKEEKDFWTNSLSYVFMTVLKKFRDSIEDGCIPYYWNKKANLIGDLHPSTIENISNRLKLIVEKIEENENTDTVVNYLITEAEKERFEYESEEDE